MPLQSQARRSVQRRTRPLTDEEYALLAMCNCRLLPRRPHTKLYCAPLCERNGHHTQVSS